MSNKKLTEEQIKEIKILQANNEMLEKSIQEAEERGKLLLLCINCTEGSTRPSEENRPINRCRS